MKFSIWYNEKEWFENILEDYSGNISSVYFALPKELWNSGRPVRQENWDYNTKIDWLLSKCREKGINTILLLNATVDSENAFSKESIWSLIKHIESLSEKGLTSISITNMLYLKILKKKFPNIKFYSSVNTRTKNLEHAIFLEKLWIDSITLDRDINRDLDTIKSMKDKTNLELQLMLNEPCLRNCPFRNTHFESVWYNSEQVFNWEFEDYTCYPMIRENNRLFFRIPFVRPEDLIHYKDYISHFKLVTRDATNDKIRFLLDIYSAEKYDGNIINIFDIEPNQFLAKLRIDNSKLTSLDFFNKIKNCPGSCDTCNMCDIFLDK